MHSTTFHPLGLSTTPNVPTVLSTSNLTFIDSSHLRQFFLLASSKDCGSMASDSATAVAIANSITTNGIAYLLSPRAPVSVLASGMLWIPFGSYGPFALPSVDPSTPSLSLLT